MNRYFSSFQKSRGGRSPPEKIRGGDHVPPRPPREIAAYGIDYSVFFGATPYIGRTVNQSFRPTVQVT